VQLPLQLVQVSQEPSVPLWALAPLLRLLLGWQERWPWQPCVGTQIDVSKGSRVLLPARRPFECISSYRRGWSFRSWLRGCRFGLQHRSRMSVGHLTSVVREHSGLDDRPRLPSFQARTLFAITTRNPFSDTPLSASVVSSLRI